MAISHINTTTNTQANGTTATATKPGGTATGDLLLAFFTCNSQNVTPPAGWTELIDETIEVFRTQVFYKVATASEGASYAFTVPAAAPLVLSVMCLRGADTADPIDIDPVVESELTHAEPYTTPTVTGGTGGTLVYFRTSRLSGSTPVTFTSAAGATERADVGIFSGGSVCYSQGLYLANAAYTTSGSQTGLAITSSGSESHNVVLTLGVKSSGIPGTMTVELPHVTDASITMSGSVAYPAVVDVTLPMPTMAVNVFNGEFEGTLDAVVSVSMTAEGYTDVRGELAVEIPLSFDMVGETRRFAENIVVPERDERWFIITQDGYRLGVRNVTHLPLRIDLPLLDVVFSLYSAAPAGEVPSIVQAFDASVTAPGGAPNVAVPAVVEDAVVITGQLIAPETTTAAGAAYDAMVSTAAVPSSADAVVVGYDAILGCGFAEISATAYNPTVTVGPKAEHVAVVATVDQVPVQASQTETAVVTATANNASIRTSASAGLVQANCHQ